MDSSHVFDIVGGVLSGVIPFSLEGKVFTLKASDTPVPVPGVVTLTSVGRDNCLHLQYFNEGGSEASYECVLAGKVCTDLVTKHRVCF